MRGPSRLAVGLAVVVPFALAVLGGLAGSPVEAAATTSIDSCTTIEEPGRYVLVTDLVDNRQTRLSQACIEIASDDVVFDGGGHVIDGKGISHTVGVRAGASARVSNVTVSDVAVSDWNNGVSFVNVTNGTVREVTAESNAFGISVDGSSDVRIVRNTVRSNLVGVDLARGNDNVTLAANTAEGNSFADVHESAGANDTIRTPVAGL